MDLGHQGCHFFDTVILILGMRPFCKGFLRGCCNFSKLVMFSFAKPGPIAFTIQKDWIKTRSDLSSPMQGAMFCPGEVRQGNIWFFRIKLARLLYIRGLGY
jgi:hypothetical protein